MASHTMVDPIFVDVGTGNLFLLVSTLRKACVMCYIYSLLVGYICVLYFLFLS